MVSAFASSWPSPPELETPRKKEESLKALKALVRDWDLLGREEEEKERERIREQGGRRCRQERRRGEVVHGNEGSQERGQTGKCIRGPKT